MLVNTVSQRKLLFPSNFNDDRFKNDFLFHMLESKFKHDFSNVTSSLNKNYNCFIARLQNVSSKLDYKIIFIDQHQKSHRDYEVKSLKNIIKLKKTSKTRNEDDTIKNNQVQYIYIYISHKHITIDKFTY